MADDPWAQFRDAELPTTDVWAQFQDAPPQQGWGGWLEDRARALGQGATFRFGDEIAAGAGAVGNKVARALGADIPELSYGDIKKQIAADQSGFEASHPKTAMALELAGGAVVPGIGAGTAIKAGNVLAKATKTGMVGRGVGSGIVTGVPAGALYGAGASEADTPGGVLADTAEGAATGAVTGGLLSGLAAPAAHYGAKAANWLAEPYQALLRSITNPKGEGTRRVAEATTRDAASGMPRDMGPLTAAEMAEAAQRGQPVTNLEGGGVLTRALARQAANTDPEARALLVGATQPRFDNQGDRMSDFLRGLGSGNNSAHQTREALQREAAAIRTPLYTATFREGARGIDTHGLQELMTAPAISGGRQRAGEGLGGAMAEAETRIRNRHAAEASEAASQGRTVPPVEDRIQGQNGMTLEFWDAVKQSLDDDIGKFQARGDNGRAREYIGVRNRLVSELDATVPSYANARGTASTFFDAGDALQAGEKFATNGAKFKNDAARDALAQMSQREQELFREGYLSRMVGTADEVKDRRDIAKLMLTSRAERERAEMVLGPRGARELEAQLHVEKLMEMGRSEISGNSQTARYLAELGIGAGAGGVAYGTTGDWRAGLVGVLAGGRRAAGAAAERRVAREIAELLASRDPIKVQKAAKKIANTPALFEQLRKVSAGLTGAGVVAREATKDREQKDPLAGRLRAMGVAR